ncbi:Glycosyltransferase family 31 protein [Pleurostoma richardsiae]|uniref:Glycosyltransferase family 31 protein n=1 Tax=Pleurostoma richardsiae TaxID=41990 RepID=A0AA38VS57_9PEZI|nr:Glycosyltransferase family 31 protein [Pleurostoma richardsiae]
MGVKLLSTPNRVFSMRNPFSRALLVAVLIVILLAGILRSDRLNVRSTVMQAATSAKQSISGQAAMSGFASKKPHDEVQVEPATPTPYPNGTVVMNCDYDKDHLQAIQEKYELGEKFEYFKRYVKIDRQDIHRKPMTNVEQRFLPKRPKMVEVTGKDFKDSCPEPLTVPVTNSPSPGSANLTDFMFGVSTTYKRFNDPKTSPINEWSYWLTDNHGNSNGGKLILLLLEATDEQLFEVWEKLNKIGIDADVFHSDPSMIMAVRYLTLVPTLYNHPERVNKKWLVICDDDTFFPSPNALADKFTTEFDSSKPLYIGALSEDVNNIHRHGSQAFGGAGVFLSVPLAKLVSDEYSSCRSEQKIAESNSGWGPQGDILLRKCIYENSEVRLHSVWDLWQLDLFGDASGFYESGIRPLSLHHYRGGGWLLAHPFEYTKLAHLCGEDCTMQRFRTADDFVISAGYSVARYPRGVDEIDFGQFERTFGALPEDKGWNLDFMLGPQRRSLHGTGRKISWELQESRVNEDGTVGQVYVRKAKDNRWKDQDGKPMSDVDGVIEMVWIS